jgi:hypothetical protein
MIDRPVHLPRKDFDSLALAAAFIPRQEWVRIFSKGREPVCFRKEPGSRFTPPHGSDGVLYAADLARTAFLECFGDELYSAKRRLSRSRWQSKAIVRLQAPALRLCDMLDEAVIAAMGLDKGAIYSTDLSIPQAWAKAVMEHPANFEGILYSSRFGCGKCIAAFERVGEAGFQEVERFDLHGSAVGDSLIEEFDIALV